MHGLPASVLALEQPEGQRQRQPAWAVGWGELSIMQLSQDSGVDSPGPVGSQQLWGQGPSAVCKSTLRALAVAWQVPLQPAVGGSGVNRLKSAGSTQSGRGVPGSQGRGSGYQGVSMRLQLDMSTTKSAPGQSWLGRPLMTLK